MATIGEIRKRSGLVIALIGVAILAFVLSDLLRSNRSLFREGRDNAVGKINGESITYKEFQQRVQTAKTNFRQRRPNQPLNEQTIAGLQDRAWNSMIFEKVFTSERKKLGLTVTNEELFALIQGENPHPTVKRAFTNPQTGEFNRQNLRRFLRRINQGLPSQASQRQAQRFKQQKQQWLQFEESLAQQRAREKYFELIRNSFYVTDLQARNQFMNENRTASIQYAALKENALPDTAVNITEKDLRSYYKEHKNNYKQEASRTVEYVVFDVTPSAKDSAMVRENLIELKDDFKNTKNDSTFIELQSEEPFDTTYLSPGEIPEPIRGKVLSGSVGDVFGPYLHENGYNLTKILDTREGETQYFNASHILFQPSGNTAADTAEARQEANEIYREIRQGVDFENMARKHSDGPTAGKGGDLGWFKEGSMVKEFNEAMKRHQKGDLFTVNTQFGTHIVKVNANPVSKEYKLGTIVSKIYPGDETYEEVYNRASDFRSSITSPEQFNSVVREKGLNKRIAEKIKPGKVFIPGLSDGGKLVRWAYSNKEGALSGILELSDQYVVAHLTEVYEKGTQPFEEVKNELRPKVLTKEKIEQLYKRFQNANAKTLEAIAKNVGTRVNSANNLKFSRPVVPGLGQAPTVVGASFGLNEGMLSEPLKGSKGAYQIKLNKLQSIEPPKRLTSTKESIRSNLSAQARVKVREALREMADVVDRRYKFN